jgi:hypothetical protein
MVAVIPKALTCVSALDKRRLESLIERTFAGEGALSSSASRVLRRLRTADLVVQPDDVPRDLVTMNSTVRLVDPINGKSHWFTPKSTIRGRTAGRYSARSAPLCSDCGFMRRPRSSGRICRRPAGLSPTFHFSLRRVAG